jgi:hypothetical protein
MNNTILIKVYDFESNLLFEYTSLVVPVEGTWITDIPPLEKRRSYYVRKIEHVIIAGSFRHINITIR